MKKRLIFTSCLILFVISSFLTAGCSKKRIVLNDDGTVSESKEDIKQREIDAERERLENEKRQAQDQAAQAQAQAQAAQAQAQQAQAQAAQAQAQAAQAQAQADIANAQAAQAQAQQAQAQAQLQQAQAQAQNGAQNALGTRVVNELTNKLRHEVSLEQGKTVDQFFVIKKGLKPCLKNKAKCEDTIDDIYQETFVKYNRGVLATILLLNNERMDYAAYAYAKDAVGLNLFTDTVDETAKMQQMLSFCLLSPVCLEIMNKFNSEEITAEAFFKLFVIWFYRQVPYAGEDIWKDSSSSQPWKYYLDLADNYL